MKKLLTVASLLVLSMPVFAAGEMTGSSAGSSEGSAMTSTGGFQADATNCAPAKLADTIKGMSAADAKSAKDACKKMMSTGGNNMGGGNGMINSTDTTGKAMQ